MSRFASRSVWTEPGTFAFRHSPLPTSRNVQPEFSETLVRAFARAPPCACAYAEAKAAVRRDANRTRTTFERRAKESLEVTKELLDMKPAQALKIFVKARDKVFVEVIKIPGTS